MERRTALTFLLFTTFSSSAFTQEDSESTEWKGTTPTLTSPSSSWTSSTVSISRSGESSSHIRSHNLTLIEMTARSLSLRWTCRIPFVNDKYELTLKPLRATYRIIETIPRNTCHQTIHNVLPETEYQVFITVFTRGGRKRSNVLTIKTPNEEPIIETELDESIENSEEESSRELRLPEVKLVELSLVGLALVLWIIAIALFFHRWGKIRMLLPYQPAYKEKQTGVNSCTTCHTMTPHHQCSRLHQGDYHGALGLGIVSLTDATCSPLRPRLNSFVHPSFESDSKVPVELRYFRKAKSVDHLISSPKLDDDIEFIDF